MYNHSLSRYVKQNKLLYQEFIHPIAHQSLSASITKKEKYDEYFYLQDNSEYFYIALDICINRCRHLFSVWEIERMLEYIQNIDFSINMHDTTLQNLIYGLSMIHSVTIIN
jgi:hypothetical protein